MNYHANDDAKEQIRQRTDIGAVIGRYTELKGHGDRLKGLCPFHKEKTPSFSVSPSRGTYHCFGCGEGGDVFDFIQKIEGVNFRDALEKLAEETGVKLSAQERRDVDDWRGAPVKKPTVPKNEMLDMHETAAEFFYERIKGNRTVIDYFKTRGLLAQTVKEFRLGYAPAGWSELCDHFKGRGVELQKVVECGFAIRKEEKGGVTYDRFRDRIIFPLFDLSGRVIAFAGRAMSAEDKAKYINSPETALYKKSQLLYGMHKARADVRERGFLLIVEGYMDYLTLYQAGIKNAAAVSGTAFTEDHARLITRFTRKITLVFDGDRAGQSAAQKALFIIAPFKLQASVLTLPVGDDPDTFVKREGAEAFNKLLCGAKAAEDFLIGKFMTESDDTPQGKSHIVTELMPYAHSLTDAIVRDAFIVKLARRLGVDEKHVRERFDQTMPPPFYGGGGGGGEPYYIDERDAPPYNDMPDDAYYGVDYGGSAAVGASGSGGSGGAGGGIGVLEVNFLKILRDAPHLITHAKTHISPEILSDTLSADIYSIMLEVYAQNGNLDNLRDACADKPDVCRALAELDSLSAPKEYLEDEFVLKIIQLRREFLKAQMARLNKELKSCAADKKEALLKRLNDYVAQVKELVS